MSIAELSQKYGRQKSRQAVNAAIRAELIGGNDVVECLGRYSSLRASAQNASEKELRLLDKIIADLQRIRDVMGDEIARRYGLKTKLAGTPTNESQNRKTSN